MGLSWSLAINGSAVDVRNGSAILSSSLRPVLNLLHAHRVSHLWHCHSMLNLFAIQTRFAPSVRKFAEPTEKWLKAYILTNKKTTFNQGCFSFVGDGT